MWLIRRRVSLNFKLNVDPEGNFMNLIVLDSWKIDHFFPWILEWSLISSKSTLITGEFNGGF
jgi:hypothetical protein